MPRRWAMFEWRLADGSLTLDARASALYGLPTSGSCRIDAHAVEAMAHPDDVPRLRETARQAAAEVLTLVPRYRIVRRDGTPRHLEQTGLVSDRDTAAKLFQPFNRLGAEYTPTDGTGLGLVIVRELVERMGGTVEVRGEKNVGSCFTVVCLPRATLTREHSVGEASTTPP